MLEAVNGCVALAAMNAGAPQPTATGAVGFAICNPATKVSVKFNPVRATLPTAVFWMVKTNVVVPFNATFGAPNAFVRVGRGLTLTQAPVVLVPLVALLVTTARKLDSPPILAVPLVLLATGQVPIVGEADVVTLTSMVQAVAGVTIWRPVTEMLPDAGVAVTVPPLQLPANPFGVAMTKPSGRVSVKLNV